MNDSKVVELFDWMDETTSVIQQQIDETYLESLTVTMEALFYGGIHREDHLKLENIVSNALKEVNLEDYSTEQIRKAIQLAVLKGTKDAIQQKHLMTPEAISLFIGYLAEKLTKNLDEVRILDPVCGTSNLLLIVMEHLNKRVKAYGSEIDPTLIKLSLLNANLQKKEVEFFHQDSLRPMLLDPVDLVVADLPVGYYPDDVNASHFELRAEKGHSYAHHLFIEQSLTYTKEGGYLIFLIPEFLFESDQAKQLHKFLQKHAHIVGLIQLPETAFKSKENKKSIFIIQKKGERTKDIKQPLLVLLPSLNDTNAMEDILVKINQWFEDSKIPS